MCKSPFLLQPFQQLIGLVAIIEEMRCEQRGVKGERIHIARNDLAVIDIDDIAFLSGIVSFAQLKRQSALRLYVPDASEESAVRATAAAMILVFMAAIIPNPFAAKIPLGGY